MPQQKSVYSFVVDGQCEYWYLQMLKDNERLQKIHIAPEFPIKESLKKQYNRVLDLAKNSERVFWIVDFDAINKESKEAKKGKKTALQEFEELHKKCKKNSRIIVIVNNPCLEYWFLLHYKQTPKYYNFYEPELKKDLKSVLSGYEKTERYFVKTVSDIYKRLKPKLSDAICNANKLGEFDFRNTQTGISEMYKIFSDLKI
ncbi:MAG: RloB family protein [Bacteroidales bacterium]|nr:RloB family protein [Bacteroidales bacterium]